MRQVFAAFLARHAITADQQLSATAPLAPLSSGPKTDPDPTYNSPFVPLPLLVCTRSRAKAVCAMRLAIATECLFLDVHLFDNPVVAIGRCSGSGSAMGEFPCHASDEFRPAGTRCAHVGIEENSAK